MSDDNFASYPKSIGEIRAASSALAKDWSPREALIAALRDIDSGKADPDALVITWRERGQEVTQFLAASPDGLVTLGLLERAKMQVQGACNGEHL